MSRSEQDLGLKYTNVLEYSLNFFCDLNCFSIKDLIKLHWFSYSEFPAKLGMLELGKSGQIAKHLQKVGNLYANC